MTKARQAQCKMVQAIASQRWIETAREVAKKHNLIV